MTLQIVSRGAATAICLGLYAWLGAAAPARSTTTPSIEGTWKIEAPRVSFVPENGPLPFTAAGRERYERNVAREKGGAVDDYDHMKGRCASPGMPRLLLTPDRFRIWQRPGLYTFQYEWNRLFRQIDMGSLVRPQLRITAVPGVTFESGDEDLTGRATPIGKGHWEGGTLVVTSAGFVDNTLVDDLVPHGYDMKVTERLRLIDPNTLEDQATIEDPETFTRPWTTTVRYERQPDAPFKEDVCLERLKGKAT